jgi:hypothetical protein
MTIHPQSASAPRSGDLILFAPPVRDLVQSMIARTQRRLLADLGGVDAKAGAVAADFVHAGCLGREGTFVEMTHPRCRGSALVERDVRTRVLVRRPAAATDFQVSQVYAESLEDLGAPYPVAELMVYYLWSWELNKLLLGRAFERVFRDRSHDVCSGSYFRWARHAGIWSELSGTLDDRPEAWYPARLAVTDLMTTVWAGTLGRLLTVLAASGVQLSSPSLLAPGAASAQMMTGRGTFEVSKDAPGWGLV